jgi:hypothetical protein
MPTSMQATSSFLRSAKVVMRSCSAAMAVLEIARMVVHRRERRGDVEGSTDGKQQIRKTMKRWQGLQMHQAHHSYTSPSTPANSHIQCVTLPLSKGSLPQCVSEGHFGDIHTTFGSMSSCSSACFLQSCWCRVPRHWALREQYICVCV